MTHWFYTRVGKEQGPISKEQLINLIKTGELQQTDLVWHADMANWAPASSIPELEAEFTQANHVSPTPVDLAPTRHLDIVEHIKVGFASVFTSPAHCFSAVLITIALIVTTSAIPYLLLQLDQLLHLSPMVPQQNGTVEFADSPSLSWVSISINQLLNIALGLCFTRYWLNRADQKPTSVAECLAESRHLLTSLIASSIYMVLVILGSLFLIIPGIYIGIRLCLYNQVIVDQKLGPIAALKYSASITKGNTLSMFMLFILSFFVIIAGILAFLVGIFIAVPVVSIALCSAYRFIQQQYASRLVSEKTTTI